MKSDYIMVGGFLGAGKTTALLKLAGHLAAGGRRVGLITNDQSAGLVDTAIVGASGYPVEEITGGCFCCRFNSLTAAAERLSETARPDVFLAEPVGSCTDLRATVQYPLRRMYGENYRIAPLSVLVDPIRALRVLGVEPGRAFSPKVHYVYRKQLEEADVIVVNKRDLVTEARLSALEAALRGMCPHAEVLAVSARTGEGLEPWFMRIAGAAEHGREAPPVDYDLYADGEALLGWCNATYRVAAGVPFDGNVFLIDLADEVSRRLEHDRPEIAHFKMTFAPEEEGGDLGVLNLVGSDREPELSHRLQEPLRAGELIVNIRAESDPERLRRVVVEGVEAAARRHGALVRTVHLEHFRPGRPTPTHRFATID
jgi:Ni2+-binding GTPase involved in maturation of urease and hydrogenase